MPDVCLQQNNAPCHKVHINTTWFVEDENEFTVLRWLPQPLNLDLIEHLGDVVEQESHIIRRCEAEKSGETFPKYIK